jgi:hypothetical protein
MVKLARKLNGLMSKPLLAAGELHECVSECVCECRMV